MSTFLLRRDCGNEEDEFAPLDAGTWEEAMGQADEAIGNYDRSASILLVTESRTFDIGALRSRREAEARKYQAEQDAKWKAAKEAEERATYERLKAKFEGSQG